METNPYQPSGKSTLKSSNNASSQHSSHHAKHTLSLFDSTCLIVGIIVGSGIYETPSQVASATTYPWQVFALWALGGLISLCGAMCYAELAAAYPKSGGDVIYLSKAYGPGAGFLFGWLQTFVARPGDISLMALVFAHYVHVLVEPGALGEHPIWPAMVIVGLLTIVNIAGLHFGKTAQNVLTVVKLIGLFAIIAIAFISNEGAVSPGPTPPTNALPWGVGLILVLFTYGGWNEMVYVASEVQNPKRNISRALILGATSVTVMYLLANAAYMHSLGWSGMSQSQAIATDAVATVLPRWGQMLVAAVITVSAAGAINGLILTGARITGAMRHFSAFRWIGQTNQRLGTPVRALILEGVIAIAVIAIAQTFANALIYTSAAVYTFYLSTSFSTVVLRRRDPNVERPYRMPFYPLPLIVFAAGCSWTIYSALTFKPLAAGICSAIIATGFVVYLMQPSTSSKPTT